MNVGAINFDEKFAITQLNQQYKQGYCSVPAMVAFLRNDYRDISLEQAVHTINTWLDEYNIKHEHLAIVYNTIEKKKVVVLQSMLDRIRQRRAKK